MTLRIKFILFAVVVHATLLILTYHFLLTDKLLFLAAEALIVVSLVITFQIYRAFVRPLNLIAAGIESIKEKDFTVKFLKTGQPEVDQLIEVYNLMMEQLRQERVSQNEKQYLLERLIQASPSGIIMLDYDGYIQQVNPAAKAWLQVPMPALLGKKLEDLPGQWRTELSILEEGQSRIFHINGIHTYRGHKAYFIDKGFPRYFIMLEELTEDIIKKEKYAYEKIIRMMSHEVNNSIGAINSILNSVKSYAPQLQEDLRADYEEALEVSIERNKNLAGFMANFATMVRLPSPCRQPCDLHQLLQGVYRLMQPQLEQRNIAWQWQLTPEPLFIEADAQQLEQVLINIAKNAMEAVDADGSINVKTQLNPPCLLIEDNGEGIPEAVRQQLFTPFFSTKKNGQGIGLTMIRDILLNHNFPFSLETDESGITAFTIQFKTALVPEPIV
ncbi:sensor histidine kinase [Adhaeribacter aerolatus]|uniref:histidine kinase n=1 Tax=Adhaeribacter aerolatus TaxID=670289 RepID=A0A512AST1_9BACT|nr:ATP-binding protein [Adhaeribacter aerolatus]GEO02740.1 sensor histidine kinase [Adhaeribacter aerolatus]